MIATGKAQSARTIKRKGHAENRSVADENDGIGKAGDDIAAGQADREALAERHRAERCQDRRDAEIGDDEPVDEADQCGHGKPRRNRQHLHADPGDAFAARNVARQHEGDGQSGQIGGGDDREIEPAGQQGQHHGEREDAELRHLEGHGLQRVDGEEPIADGNREHRPEREQQQGERGNRAAAEPDGQCARRRVSGRLFHGRALLVRRSRCDQAVTETEMRMTNPTKSGDQ